ncbi:MAG TPA: hypothetical protein VD997_00215 [Phycisphaerales bacterium]|nr:hypothetical protein [Phycisphaerales bacterium]
MDQQRRSSGGSGGSGGVGGWHQSAGIGLGSLGFADLMATLVWPRLLAAARLALRPARLGLGVLMLVLIGLIAQIPRLWVRTGADTPYDGPLSMGSDLARRGLSKIIHGVFDLSPKDAAAGLFDLFIELPRQLIDQYPWGSLAVFVPALLVWAVGGGAIARSAATEFSLDRRTSWPRALAFALSRWGSLFSSLAAPLLIVGLLIGLMAVLGLGLLGIAYVNVVTSMLYFLVLLAGFVAVVILVAYLLATPMLVPACACEGTDAIDGIQRCYAYVTGRPFKLVLYSAILLVQAVVVAVVIGALAQATISLSLWSSSLLLPEFFGYAVQAQGDPSITVDTAALSPTAAFATRVVGFWVAVPALIVGAYVVSFWFSGGTVLYLLMRQVCDGQDTGELWTPGLIAGTHATPEAEPAPEVDEEE